MAWGYTKQTIDMTGKDGKHAGYLVWSAYVLQKRGTAWKVVLLDWSVRRLDAAGERRRIEEAFCDFRRLE